MVDAVRQSVVSAIKRTQRAWAKAKSIGEIREGFDALLEAPPVNAVDYFLIGDIPCAWIGSKPPDKRESVILYCHGGGFQVGSIRSHFGLMRRLSAAAGLSVLGFDYRLAPEHRFPAAHEDAEAVYRWMLGEGFKAARIAIAGDSAGASLALGIAGAHLKDGAAPGCLALISPWLDLTLSGASYASRAELDIFSKAEQLGLMARTYLGKTGDPGHNLLNPLTRRWSGLPPTLVHVGDHDITRDDGVGWAETAERAGADVTVKIWPEMYHHFQVFPQLPEAEASLADIAAFIAGHLQEAH